MAKAQPNHVLHFILSLITGGLWLPVWLGVTVLAGNPHTGQPYSGVLSFAKWWLIVIVAMLPFAIGLVIYEAMEKRNSLEAVSSPQQTQTR